MPQHWDLAAYGACFIGLVALAGIVYFLARGRNKTGGG